MLSKMKILLSVFMEILFRFSSRRSETESTLKDIRESENLAESSPNILFSDVLYVYDDNNNLML